MTLIDPGSPLEAARKLAPQIRACAERQKWTSFDACDLR